MASGLKSAEAKLIRAAKQIRALKKCVAAYSRSKPHKIVKKSKGKKKLNVPKTPPLEIALLAGEIVYHMRSALDHLVFEVIKRNPHVSAIDPNWEKYCEFPLWTDPLKLGQKTPLYKSKFSRQLPGISDEAFAFIESVQPYYRLGGVNNALGFLAHLSNIDKHRRLNFTRPGIVQFQTVKYAHGLSSRGYATLDRGAEIYPVPAERPLSNPFGKADKPMYVQRHYRALVAFDERRYLGEATGLTIDGLLDYILGRITAEIIPKFRKFLKKP